MAEQPAAVTSGSLVQDAAPASSSKGAPKAPQNPVFRMMGLPNFSFKLPSRNWLIFLSITGSFTTALLYDRYHRRKAQQKWCKVVSGLAQEPLPTTQLPRTITVFLSAPPGDGLRAAREHFHEYVKPILVAGALDWEVIEGRKEGEVRAGLAAKIRRLRKRNGEKGVVEDVEEDTADRMDEFRRGAQIRRWDGVEGDLILGRHTWKEYVRGLHEGWLGPLDDPHKLEESTHNTGANLDTVSQGVSASTTAPLSDASVDNQQAPDILDQDSADEKQDFPQESPASPPPAEQSPEKAPPKPSLTPPFLTPAAYPTYSLSSTAPSPLPPSTVLPFPHLLGFLNTPIRIYRFLTRRHLTDATGQLVAELVLASNTRQYERGQQFISNADLDEGASPSNQPMEVVEAQTTWEQESTLFGEEAEWHKSARAPNADDTRDLERPWQEGMAIDERIGERMRTFELTAEEKNERIEDAEAAIRLEASKREGFFRDLTGWLDLRSDEGVKGWEMGLIGDEDGQDDENVAEEETA